MLATLQGAYPSAHIFLALGPMLIDNYPVGATYLQTARTYLENIAAAANAGGSTKVSLLRFESLTDAQKGCDSHPNAVAHASMAQTLQAALNTNLGW